MKTEPIEALKILDETRLNPIHEIPRYKAELAAKIAFQEGQSSPKIKQLEWGCEGFHRTDGSLPDEICASTPLGAKYYIYHLRDTVFQLAYGYRTIATYLDHGVEDVKAIAQADFERRVMECLE